MKLKLALAGTLLCLSVMPYAAAAQTIASKVEEQGHARYVQITALKATERNGFLAVEMELANNDRDAQQVFWRIKWLDDAGFQVWDDEPWKPVRLHGSARQNLRADAPTVKARDFRIQFNASDNWSSKPSAHGASPYTN